MDSRDGPRGFGALRALPLRGGPVNRRPTDPIGRPHAYFGTSRNRPAAKLAQTGPDRRCRDRFSPRISPLFDPVFGLALFTSEQPEANSCQAQTTKTDGITGYHIATERLSARTGPAKRYFMWECEVRY